MSFITNIQTDLTLLNSYSEQRLLSVLCPPFWILESRNTHAQKSCILNVTKIT